MNHKDLIEKFIQNRLSSKEKKVFDKLINDDIRFKEEVSFHSNLKKVVRKEEDIKFKNLISNLELKAKKTQQKNSYVKWSAAAIIILLLSLTYFLTLDNKATSRELFSNYFEPYRNVIQPIERSDDNQDEKALAFFAYEEGDYETAITLFSSLYTTTKEPYYLFYKANALLELERVNEAVPLLLKHLKTKDTLTEKTIWYLALAYLKMNDKSNAKKALEKVIINGKYKTKEAKKLFIEID